MALSGVNHTQSSLEDARSKLNSGNDLTNKDVFFKILAAELSNQDPLKGKDGTEYVGQLAQFTALEQTQQMYNVLNRVLMSQSVTEGNSMIGKEVEFAVMDKDGTYKTEKGIVSSVKVEGGLVYLITKDDKKYQLNQSIGFKDVKSQSVTEAGMMIGKQVDFSVKDKDGKVTTEIGIVSSVKVEDGKVYLITKDNKKYEINQVTGFGDVTEVGMMIGKQVDFSVKDSDGKVTTETGIVSSVKIEDGKTYLITKDGKKYEINQVIGFGETPETTKPEETPEIPKVDEPENVDSTN